MKVVAAIVESVVDVRRYERSVVSALIAFRDAESRHAASVTREESDRETATQRRLHLGKELHDAREAWDRAPGSFSETWRSFLARVGVEDRTARNYIAEYKKTQKKEQPPDSNEEPPEGAGDDSGDSQSDSRTSSKKDAEPFHILIASGEFRDKVRQHAERWPAESRRSIPGLLRDLADEIESEFGC